MTTYDVTCCEVYDLVNPANNVTWLQGCTAAVEELSDGKKRVCIRQEPRQAGTATAESRKRKLASAFIMVDCSLLDAQLQPDVVDGTGVVICHNVATNDYFALHFSKKNSAMAFIDETRMEPQSPTQLVKSPGKDFGDVLETEANRATRQKTEEEVKRDSLGDVDYSSTPSGQSLSSVAPSGQSLSSVAPSGQSLSSVAPSGQSLSSVAPSGQSLSSVAPSGQSSSSVAPSGQSSSSVAATTDQSSSSVAATTDQSSSSNSDDQDQGNN